MHNILHATPTPSNNTGEMELKKTHNFLGFANFPNQIYRRAIKNGFEFTLMVVGQSGLGKTTFINSLFLTENEEQMGEGMQGHLETTRTMNIQESTKNLSENGVNLELTLIDCPGFGDFIDNSKCFEPIIQHIESKFLKYFCEETKIDRPTNIQDKRVHLCLYFIAPSGHRLKPLDIMIMKCLHDRVNLLPIIAKADTMTTAELSRFKKNILEDIAKNEIKLYSFPEFEDDEERRKFGPLRERTPFAVRKDANGCIRRCREYPWGTVEVENLNHNDFIAIRDMIIRLNLIDLILVTRNVHYENFRLRQLNKGSIDTTGSDPFTALEAERRLKEKEFEERIQAMETAYAEKVRDYERRFEVKENELDSMKARSQQILEEKRNTLKNLVAEVVELKRASGVISRHESCIDINLLECSIKGSGKKNLGLFLRKE